jgi:class I fructose-bisphosphate aldolase
MPEGGTGGVKARLNRLWNQRSGRCLDVALDHGCFGEPSFLTGIEDMPAAVRTVAAAGPDAIQLTVGQAELLQSIRGRERPALVLRLDVANVYGAELPATVFSRMIRRPVEQALRLDAACVVVNLFHIPARPELTAECIDNVLQVKPDCDRYGMPLMIEPLVFAAGIRGGYRVDGDTAKIAPLVRQAVELGADVIKADPTDDLGHYHEVVRAARVPVLVRGGARLADRELLERTAAVLEQGAAGIVYGRNIIQHRDPAAMTRALMALTHEGATAEETLRTLQARP